MVNWEDGVKVSDAYVNEDGTITPAVYESKTPLSAYNLNKMQTDLQEQGIVVSSTEPTTGERVWIQKGKNLFDKNKVVEGYELQNTDGSISKVDTWWVSEYISVKSNETYYLSANENRSKGTTNAFYDENKNYLSYVEVITGAILIPENVKYVRFNGRIDEIDSNIMFEQGTVATEYEEYIEPKIHVKNDNGVYEEFMKKEEIYSTEEQKIGKWIDGKPLYRKAIVINSLVYNSALTAFLLTQINNLDNIIEINGALWNSSKSFCHQLPYINNNGLASRIYYDINGNSLYFISADTWSSAKLVVSIKYTKTTD